MTDFDKNTWQTPKYVFNWLKNRFSWFDLDGCANAKNALCCRYIGEQGTDDDENLSIAPDFLADNHLTTTHCLLCCVRQNYVRQVIS